MSDIAERVKKIVVEHLGVDEAKAVLTEEEAGVAGLYYDINEIGEMHHNPAKNVLYVRASIEEIAGRLKAAPA